MWRMRKNCRAAWDQKACRKRENKGNYVFWALDGIVSKALPDYWVKGTQDELVIQIQDFWAPIMTPQPLC